ncbi:hypothetical protein ACKI2N_002570 [Cupriavidus sp. 30B13]|uniref:hypothetical protein n=1 Tax=Cupriavidus sp. 30B13 TaxID=3384241 RepID=UPI003B8EE3FD
MMIQEGKLVYGVEFPAQSGILHYDFAMRLPTIDDNVAAIEEVGTGSSLRMNVAMLARCLTRLGDIPKEEITTALLNTMVDDDYDVLAEKRDELKKKRRTSSAASRTTASPSSSSAATASPSQPSAN